MGIHVRNDLVSQRGNLAGRCEHGANRVDASLAGLRGGSGCAPIEIFVAAAGRLGLEHGCDLNALVDAAENLAAARGKVSSPDAQWIPQVRLDPGVLAWLADRAKVRGAPLSVLVNDLLKKNIALIEAVE